MNKKAIQPDDDIAPLLVGSDLLRQRLQALSPALTNCLESFNGAGPLTIADLAFKFSVPIQDLLAAFNCTLTSAGRLSACIIPDARLHRDGDRLYINVTGLEAPQPLVAILSVLDQPDFEGPLTATIDRDPLYLYAELAERGWNWKMCSAEPGNFVLEMTKAGAKVKT